ncbi:MAG TPA: hydantoinase/oxoprolinase family protein, partial [Rhodopila sp.]|nr:hydantoinase/oxoprolinase family protein [Rhodopila sp.]
LTTAGFRDVLEIGRIRTPGMFDLSWRKPQPLVPRRWRLEITERIAADGTVLTKLDEESVHDAVAVFRREAIESVAICCINSYVNPIHERRIHALVSQLAPELMLTASCDVLPEIKEYERTSTAVVNAYLLPAMRRYLTRLSDRLAEIGITAPVQVMASNGGMIGLEAARQRPVFAVGSGPAGGVTGTARLSTTIDTPHAIVFDMGGTTAKASIVEDGRPALVTEYEFRDGISSPSRFIKGGGFMLKVPAIDIAEVGSGGGSIAHVDAGGLLVVGPESAGGDPGPACYGRGATRPTVTDANMVLGYLNPHALAGGSLPVNPDLSHRAIEQHVARPLGISVIEAAHGIRAVANAGMARALRAVTVERGRDPRDMVLVAFGGGGPLHAVDVARALDIRRILITPASGVFSAAGMLTADVEHDVVRPILASLADVTDDQLRQTLAALREDGLRALAAEGYDAANTRLRFAADLRYLGQSSELTVPLPDPFLHAGARSALIATFHAAYRATYGYHAEEPVELVNLRLVAVGLAAHRLDFTTLRLSEAATAGATGTRRIHLPGCPATTAHLFARDHLHSPDMAHGPIQGPAIIESYDTTILIPPGYAASPEAAGAIALSPIDGAA